MTGLEVVAALAAIVGTLAALRQIGTDREATFSGALRALSDAATATEKYVSIEAKKRADRTANYDLTNAWHKASLAFRDAGHEKLQELCRLKGDYWLDPSGWEEKQASESCIKLAEVRRELNRLLAKGRDV